jgi:hypothetical protein
MNEEPKRKDIFTDEEMQRLVLAYMYGCGFDGEAHEAVEVPTVDIAAFLNACSRVILEAQSIKMVIDGLLFVQWNKETGKFTFALSETGVKEAEAFNGNQATT